MKIPPLALALACAVSPFDVSNAAPLQEYFVGRITRMSLTEDPVPEAPLGRCEAGHVTPDLRMDALVLFADQGYLIDGVDSFGTNLPLVGPGFTVADALLLKPHGGAPSSTIIALVTDIQSGVQTLNELTFTYASAGQATSFANVVIGASGWEDVTRLGTGDLDGDSAIEILGLTRSSLERMEHRGPGLFTPETAVPLSRTWGGFEVATWDDPALDRLIVHDENTIQVLNVSGALIEQISGFTAPIRCIEPWQFRSSNESRIATVTWNDSTPDGKLWVHGPGGYIEPTIPLGGIRTYELYAGDYSQNGHDDLFLVSAWDAVLIWLFNSGGPNASTNTTFSTTDDGRAYSEPFSLHPLIGIGNQYGGGATGDVDNDGDIDFLLACDRTHDVHIKRNTLFHEVTRMVPHVVASSYYRVNPLIPAGIATGTYNAHGGELSLWFELPADGAGSHTHVQHTLYQIGDLDPERVVASELLLLSALSPLDPNAPPHQAPLIGNSSSAPILTSAAYRSTTATTDRASYRLHTRLVTLDSGVITASTPESTFEFVHDRTFSAGWSPTAVPDTGNPGPPTPAADPNEVPPPRVPPTPPPGGN